MMELSRSLSCSTEAEAPGAAQLGPGITSGSGGGRDGGGAREDKAGSHWPCEVSEAVLAGHEDVVMTRGDQEESVVPLTDIERTRGGAGVLVGTLDDVAGLNDELRLQDSDGGDEGPDEHDSSGGSGTAGGRTPLFHDRGEGEEDYVVQRYGGHRNYRTVKGVSFMGACDEYVVSGSDDGHVYIWSTEDGVLRQWLEGDEDVVNCLEPHPWLPLTLATSGIDYDVKVWQPTSPEARTSLPVEAERVMQDNQTRRDRPVEVLHVTPNLLRLLFTNLEYPGPSGRRRRGRRGRGRGHWVEEEEEEEEEALLDDESMDEREARNEDEGEEPQGHQGGDASPCHVS